MLKNSIKQMMRTPFRTAAFLILIGISSLLLTLGCNLFYISAQAQEAAKGAFATIGTVRQKPSGAAREKYWNPETGDYEAYSVDQYGAAIPYSALDIEGLPYIHKPKHQPFYAAYTGDYVVRNTHSEVDESWWGIGADCVIAEMEPFEDCMPDHPVKLHFKKSLYGNITDRMLSWIWFWDYENPHPKPLKAGQTYIMALYMDTHLGYSGILDKYEGVSAVWTPWLDVRGSQYKKDGTMLKDEKHKGRFFEQVTEGFYETAEGKRWLNIIEGFTIANYSIPVTPTNATKLLMYFYNGNAGISEGRDITEEEYASGAKVCLVDSKFAANNQLKPGDKLRLPLYYADYSAPACYYYPYWAERTVTEKMINADGQLYDVFEENEYEIAGIYQVTGGMQDYTGYEAPQNGVIIPAASVENSDEDNILNFSPMKPSNTIFQIENGTIDDFLAIWEEKGIDGLELAFEDNGYSELMHSFENTRKMSVILLGAGAGITLLILVFFCHMFITKQKVRTALERSLGVPKGKCLVSLCGGILLIVLIGVMIGSSMGAAFTKKAVTLSDSRNIYSSAFSANQAAAREIVLPEDFLKEQHMDVVLPCFSGALNLTAALLTAFLMAAGSLKKEPLELLSGTKQER